MQYRELIEFLQHIGKDPSRLIFEDELTRLHNRRFLLSYFEHKVHWEEDGDFPLSLLVMDVDRFKSINDTFGHGVGDEALGFVSSLLREVAGEDGYPIRFGGDEFMLLLPGTGLEEAVARAHRLSQLTKERALRLQTRGTEIQLSLSIGVASARSDAQSGADLIRKADGALYTAKKLGRDRVAIASQADPEAFYPRAALHRLDQAAIAGRKAELSAVSDALAALSSGSSGFLVLEGAPGMGKSTLLESIGRGIAPNDTLRVAQLTGNRQENYRPYYLVGEALVSLMHQREDGGEAVLGTLDARGIHYLGHVLPHLDRRSAPIEEDDRRRRQGIFMVLLDLVAELLDGKALVLLIDDLHFADEASLALLRVLLSRDEPGLLVCATVTETVALGREEEAAPWERFYATYGDELRVQKRRLEPLTAGDIAEHLAGVFPGIDLPEGFETELAETTQGNPLFLGEIVRKLVLDQKLALVGQRWTLERPEEGYLPRSLEAIVDEKIAALDEEGRDLLERVSALGEHVPLSVVTGATELSENKVLQFLDRAETLGFLKSDFHLNDETMRFLGKRVLEIVYGSMQPARRQELHERVGAYHEELYRSRLGASASILAYHFKRSANLEKASRYDQIRTDLSRRTFDSSEAEHYAGELPLEEEPAPQDPKLGTEALACLPNLFRNLLTTVRSVQLYPAGSKPIQKAHAAAFEAVAAIVELSEHVNLSRAQGVLLANGHRVDSAEFRLLADSYLELLDRAELEGIELRRGVEAHELEALLTHLGRLKPDAIDGGYWKRFAAEHRLQHIVLRQMRYSELRRRKVRGGPPTSAVGESELEAGELSQVPPVLRALSGAVKNIKLYPLGSQPVSSAIEGVHDALGKLLSRRPSVTFASAGGSVLVNGARLPTGGQEALVESYLAFMASSELTSLTFLRELTREDLEAFIGALKEPPSDLEPSFWKQLAEEKQISGIVFNDRRYRALLVESVLETDEAEPELDGGDLSADSLSTLMKDLLLRGEPELARKVLGRIFADYAAREREARETIVGGCHALVDGLIQALQHQFASVAVDFLLRALEDETEDGILADLANLLHRLTASALQFADFTLASRVFIALRERQRELLQSSTKTGRALAVLNRKMDPSTRMLLMEELQSKEPLRQERAAQVLESMGKPAISLLVEVIKQEKDFRTRQLAAGLLAKMGREGAETIKREVVLEVTSEQRFRILEVIDVVTGDLKTELAFCLSDVNPKVRRAAFRLSERLGDKQVLELLVDFARHPDLGVAKGAIRSLANLRTAHGVGALVSTLEVTKDPERAIACAQALAQLADPIAVPALEAVLTARKYPLLGARRWDDQVRATAAFALAQIGGDRAKAALSRISEDPDPRIRRIATSGLEADRRPRAPVEKAGGDANEVVDDEGEGWPERETTVRSTPEQPKSGSATPGRSRDRESTF